MAEDRVNDAKRAYIEEMGVFMASHGLTRMDGRVLGALLVAEPAETTAEALASLLMASRSSISVALRRLEGWGFVDRVSKAGERKDFFRNRPDAWTELMQRRQRTLIDFQRMAARGLELLETDDPDARRGLTEMLEFYTYFEREQPKILRGWLAWKAARERGSTATAEDGGSS